MISIKYKKFKAPGSEPVRVVSPDFMVISWVSPDEWIELREEVWQDAYSQGCISDDMNRVGVNPLEAVAALKAQEIAYEDQVRKAIKQMLDDGDPSNFDGAGKPKIQVIADIIGTSPAATLRDKIFKEFKEPK